MGNVAPPPQSTTPSPAKAWIENLDESMDYSEPLVFEDTKVETVPVIPPKEPAVPFTCDVSLFYNRNLHLVLLP